MKREDGFTKVSNRIIDNLDIIEGNTLKVYLAIRSCVDGANEEKGSFPAVSWIAEKVGLTRHSVERHIRILKRMDVLATKRRFNNSSLYTFKDGENGRFDEERKDVLTNRERTVCRIDNKNQEEEPLLRKELTDKDFQPSEEHPQVEEEVPSLSLNIPSSVLDFLAEEKELLPEALPKEGLKFSQTFQVNLVQSEALEALILAMNSRYLKAYANGLTHNDKAKLRQEHDAWERGSEYITDEWFNERLTVLGY
jgi:DNA-binding MarR family transcriptional regulator